MIAAYITLDFEGAIPGTASRSGGFSSSETPMSQHSNALNEQSRSLWMESEPLAPPPLSHDTQADAVVVGAGIAGLSTAYELAARGLKVVVLDKASIGGGMTLRTSAHLSCELDDYYFKLSKRRSDEATRAYYESQKAAVDRIEAIATAESIDCDFARVDAFIVSSGPDGDKILDNEREGARKAGFIGAEKSEAPRGFSRAALRFPDQARFHPAKYLQGLVQALEAKGAKLYANSPVEKIEDVDDGVVVTLANGAKVNARQGVSATNSPINGAVSLHAKQAPYRTYVIAMRAPKGTVPDALIWDTEDPYHYVRIQPGEDEDIVLIGGEDHKSGLNDDGADRIERLRLWALRHYPNLGEVTHAWSGQVYETIDFVPYIGLNPGEKNYVITGDSGEGLTSGVAGAILVADLITKGGSPWAVLYDPSRVALAGAASFLSDTKDVAANFAEHLTGGEVDAIEDLEPGSGALVRRDGKKIAAYREQDGKLHVVSAACTHMGCVVQFNSFERCWDCPCHGSQFDIDGEPLAGPARKPLEKVEI
jgi:glycine/D-amino acid oxidase-like deaminating enzyme/nitrite reductase/ring-hydroxylating ferredoxin subunit